MSKVAIFGSGLSAAYIYAACLDNGVQADFFTDRPLTEPTAYGQIILRWVPERLKLKTHPIWLFSLGSLADYLKRLNRTAEDEHKTTFPATGRVEEQVYNPGEFLEKVWRGDEVETLGKFTDKEILDISAKYDHTFVTFPLQESKQPDRLVSYWYYELKNLDISLPNMAIYNATDAFPWTRYSNYWGTMTWEYSHTEYTDNPPPSPSHLAKLNQIRDIAPNIPEYASPWEKVTLVGRWARWKKGVQAYEAYAQTDKILKEKLWNK